MSPASSSSREPLAVIFGLNGAALSGEERRFFADADPLGFILFARNCEAPAQVARLVVELREAPAQVARIVVELREAVGRADAPVLIDQEGGRVARLKPPHWRDYPPPARIAALGGMAAREAAWLGARLIADDLAMLGITVDCTPVLDLPVPGADPIIGDRAWAATPARAAELGLAVCDGLMAGGVLPVIKHIPGHGRGNVDSHKGLPVVETPRETLDSTDFAAFRALAFMPWAMTAHILYSAVDAQRPATLSPSLIRDVIRTSIGFDGVLVSDDLSMQALGGSLPERAQGALAAGCDLVLHCNGDMTEMSGIAASIGAIGAAARRRIDAAEARRRAPGCFDRFAVEQRFDALMAGAR